MSAYVNETGIVQQQTARPKVGQAVPVRRALIVTTDPFATLDSVKAMAVQADSTHFGGKRVTAVRSLWNDQGTRFSSSSSRSTTRTAGSRMDPAGRHERTLRHIHDPAWFGGAGPARRLAQPVVVRVPR